MLRLNYEWLAYSRALKSSLSQSKKNLRDMTEWVTIPGPTLPRRGCTFAFWVASTWPWSHRFSHQQKSGRWPHSQTEMRKITNWVKVDHGLCTLKTPFQIWRYCHWHNATKLGGRVQINNIKFKEFYDPPSTWMLHNCYLICKTGPNSNAMSS